MCTTGSRLPATLCNVLQRSATLCNALQHSATPCYTLWHTLSRRTQRRLQVMCTTACCLSVFHQVLDCVYHCRDVKCFKWAKLWRKRSAPLHTTFALSVCIHLQRERERQSWRTEKHIYVSPGLRVEAQSRADIQAVVIILTRSLLHVHSPCTHRRKSSRTDANLDQRTTYIEALVIMILTKFPPPVVKVDYWGLRRLQAGSVADTRNKAIALGWSNSLRWEFAQELLDTVQPYSAVENLRVQDCGLVVQ